MHFILYGKIGVVALPESQRFDNKIHQNEQLSVYFCFLLIVLRFWINFLQKITSFTFLFRFYLEMRMIFSNFMNSLLTNIIL